MRFGREEINGGLVNKKVGEKGHSICHGIVCECECECDFLGIGSLSLYSLFFF